MEIKLLKLVGGNWREEGKRGWRRRWRRSLVRLARLVRQTTFILSAAPSATVLIKAGASAPAQAFSQIFDTLINLFNLTSLF